MLSFINYYVITPVTQAIDDYVIEPIFDSLWDLGSQAATQAAVENGAAFVTTKAAELTNIAIQKEEEQKEENTQSISDVAQSMAKGAILETGLSLVLSAGDPTPARKVLAYLMPRAAYLAQQDNDIRTIVTGALKHAIGNFAKTQVDTLTPTLAPYGGYAAYGAASAATETVLNRLI